MMDITYEKDVQTINVSRKFLKFLEEFTIEDPETREPRKPYVEQAHEMRRNERTTIYVDFIDLLNYRDLADAIVTEFYRHEPALRKAVQTFIFNLFKETGREKIYYVAFHNFPNIDKIRDLKTDRIARLTAITGTITRTTEVRPELVYGSFLCPVCNSEVRDVEQQFRYTEPKLCSNANCDNRTKWELQVNDSVFCDWQKLRVQENANEIPTGGMPRSIDVILRNEMVDQAKPGDRCVFVGTLVVVPEVVSLLKPGEKAQVDLKKEGSRKAMQKGFEGVLGLKQLGVRDLNYKMVFLATFVQSTLNRFDLNIRDENRDEEVLNQFTIQEKEEILKMKDEQDLYRRMAMSISPSVWGHQEIKKGLLLMLFGGVNDKETHEGMRLRGDINLCIVGDPSTAKSQFLKFVCSFLPRTVYTSGKATSAAGLTAAVQRDPDSGEFCLEAGALMLADNGICCIDEFDKMDIKDQVAIHEAMEQQTISIAKAGIQATLNARCSILAAANPIFGRYDKTKSLKYNLDMSAPIMSRFDLFFVVLDECNETTDYSIAQHIVNLHRNKEAAIQSDFTAEQMQRYIRFARTIKPEFSREAAIELREAYKKLRLNDVTSQKSAYRITVRQLESMIRLSEALARVHCSKTITPEYVKEAARLLSNSILRVERPDLEIEPFDENIDLNANIRATDTNIIEEELREMRIEETKKTKITLTYDDYIKIAKTITYYFKEQEREGQAENGIKQSDVVNWFVQQNLDNIQSLEQADQLAKITHSVIQRLIAQEKVLIILRDDPDYKERILQLHPNHVESL